MEACIITTYTGILSTLIPQSQKEEKENLPHNFRQQEGFENVLAHRLLHPITFQYLFAEDTGEVVGDAKAHYLCFK